MRIAVNTGEALVTLDARAAEGEGMAAGDVVNTTARLQSAAPVNGILVGESDLPGDAARDRVRRGAAGRGEGQRRADRGLGGAAARGRASASTCRWRRARRSSAASGSSDVVRERPAPRARGALAAARHARRRARDRQVAARSTSSRRSSTPSTELISWRQGRSLPYGEGVSFWALAEMVKAQAGILETDDVAEAEAKLRRQVADVVPERGGRRLGAQAPRHAPRAGRGALGGDQRGEAFSAWRRFFEALAEQRPLVLVFEDLHWADDGLLDFVDHLVDWAAEVPILVVGTARPELLERRPGWGGGKANAITLSLSPLSNDDTARLIGSLLGSSVRRGRRAGRPARARRRQPALRRAVRADAGRARRRRGAAAARVGAGDHRRAPRRAAGGGEAAAPGRGGDRQGVLARRGRARSASDAARRAAARARAQAVRPPRAPLLDGRRDAVRLPARCCCATSRTARSRGRAGSRSTPATAEWIEAHGRPEDHAEMLAHHYTSALELARAARQDVSAIAPRGAGRASRRRRPRARR